MTQAIPSRALPRPFRQGTSYPLLCLTYAGGGTRSYAGWQRLLPSHVDALTLRLPGRETRVGEPLPDDLCALAEQIAVELRARLPRRFALFGHSVGALTAYELARVLRAAYGIEPGCLFVSGMPAPDHFNAMTEGSGMDSTDLRENVLAEAGPEAVDDPEFWALIAPVIRSDLALGSDYRYVPAQPLTCPLVAYGATYDSGVDETSLNAWRTHTTGPFESRTLPGDHFYFRRWPEILAADITGRLDQYLGERHR